MSRDIGACRAYTCAGSQEQESAISKASGAVTDAKDQSSRASAARQFAIDAARLAASTRCHSVVVLDVTGLSPVADYFVIATGTSARQMRTVADDIGELGEKHDFAPFTISGHEGETWMLLDCIDVVVHIFSADARQYYDLDGLWGDAKPVKWDGLAGTDVNLGGRGSAEP